MKYDVYAVFTGTRWIGTFEAESEQDIQKSLEDACEEGYKDLDVTLTLCHQCADRVEMEHDTQKFIFEPVEG